MELFVILIFIICVGLFFKIFSLIFHVGMFAIALPFKILSIVLSVLFMVLLIPLGILGGLAGILLAPLALLVPLIPIALIIWGVVLLVKNL